MMSLKRRLALASALFLLPLSGTAWADTFTIAVIPDTQNYADITLPQPLGEQVLSDKMRYILETREEKNTAFVTFVGDIVQHGDGQFRRPTPGGKEGEFTYYDSRGEWDIANRAISILSRSTLPFGMVPGNHDYDSYSWWNGENSPGRPRPIADGKVWELYFGPESRHFAGKDWYKGSHNQGLSSYQIFTGGDRQFLHISLEMDANAKGTDWAQSVIDANPGLPVIITTHEWLLPKPIADDNKRPFGYEAYFVGGDNQSPDQIWDRFVRKNDQIFMILSGHHFTRPVDGVSQGENLRVDTNDAGYPVYQMLQDYQGNSIGKDGKPGSVNGGAGWMRFMEFDTDAKKIRVYTYSPYLDRYAGKDGTSPFGTPANYSNFELDFPPQLTR